MQKHHLDECVCCANAHEHTTELEQKVAELLKSDEDQCEKIERYERALRNIIGHNKVLNDNTQNALVKIAKQAIEEE